MISIKCPNAGCGKMLRVDDSAAGQTLACPSCGKPVKVPANVEALPELKPTVPSAGASSFEPSAPAPPPPQWTDQELTARLRQRATATPPSSGGSLVEKGKRRYMAAKIHREIEALERALKADITAIGVQVLEGNTDGLAIDEEKQRLQTILTEMEEREVRRSTLAGAKGTGSLARDLAHDIERLEKLRENVLAQIGQKACDAGRCQEESQKKVRTLEAMLRDQRHALAELGPEFADGGASAVVTNTFHDLWARFPGRKWIGRAVILGVCSTVVWLAYTFTLPFLAPDALHAFRYFVPENAGTVIVIDMTSPRMKELYRQGEIASAPFAIVLGRAPHRGVLPLDAHNAITTMFAAGSFRNDEVLGVVCAEPKPEITEEMRRTMRTREYKGHTIWSHDAETKDRALCIDDSGRLLTGSPSWLLEAAIDRQQTGKVGGAVERISTWAHEVPSGQDVWFVSTEIAGLPVFSGASVTIERFGIRALVGSIAAKENLAVRTKLICLDESEAERCEQTLTEMKRDLWTSRGDFKLPPELENQWTTMVDSIQIVRDGQVVEVAVSISTRMLFELIQDAARQLSSLGAGTGISTEVVRRRTDLIERQAEFLKRRKAETKAEPKGEF